jgi:hypothetical protein
MSIPKTARIILKPRAEAERVAITLEYLASFLIWAERLSQSETSALKVKIERLGDPANDQNLNRILKDCIRYITVSDEE